MQVRNEVKELRLLFEVLQILDSASDLSDNLETVLEVMAEHTGMMRGVITLLDEAHGEIAIEAAYGMSAEAQSKGRYKLGEGITGKVIESGKPLVIPNVLVEPLFLNRTGSRSRKEAVSFICVPVKMEGRVIGALSADRLFAASEALEEDMRLLSVLASLISKAVKNRQERHRMLEENRRLLDVLRERSRPEMFVGRSPGLRAVLTQLAQVAPTSATVLLLGESGTGKELAANTIHAGSPRAGHPFIKINCAALPEGLIESELFGHEKGAFTGAVGMRKGRFEAADGGTLFLDENRRACRFHAGQAAARVAGAGIRAARRHGNPQGGRARRGGHEPESRADGQGRAVPQGPVLSAERVSRLDASTAGTAGGHSSARRELP